ncbi:cysteine desulfurase family protein [Priestia taiwanensis]|uniref:Aminotransferase V n=1 Tax=Priestia taiwanensis TaxID=1347902 RepID=A0A917AW73_9BACI|nr:cysteine desulfurase family protein [Priestia taiwanensis]MBM7363428.1 cysteine desulfurase [Priestia taiwanensis]GGE77250.1 aminotransferase V [Priestia taiwanensis]
MIYFDNSATTKPYKEVLDAFVTVSTNYFGNPSSIHQLGSEAERLLTQSRTVVASLLHVKQSEIVFTSGGTEGNNLAIKGIALKHRNRGKHIITSQGEHPSVVEACKQLEQVGFDVTYLPLNEQGVVTVQSVKEALRDDTILVSLIHVNNEIGSIQPIQEIAQLLKNYPKVFFHVDHVQGIGKVPISLQHIDLCTVSGHKFHSVKGTGILYIRNGVKLDPLLSGGQQESFVRSGTENLAGIVAMTKALRMTLEKSKEAVGYVTALKEELQTFLEGLDYAHVNSPVGGAPHILNVSFIGLKPEVLVHAFEERGIFVSTKSACSSKQKEISRVLLALGLQEKIAESAIRISLSFENTKEEVEAFKQAVIEIVPNLYEVMR